MRRVAVERVPAGDGALAELVLRADDLPRVAIDALPDRQRQAVVALLADHPVAHVSEPVELALLEADVRRQPRHVARRAAHRLAQRVHGDEPLVDEAEDQLRPTAPAMGVRVRIALGRHQQPSALEVGGDVLRQVGRVGVVGGLRQRGRSASRSRRRRRRTRRSGRSPAGRTPSRARSPPARSPGRCGRCLSSRRRRPRPTG